VPPQKLDYVLGITKAYSTRVGSGPFPTELTDATGEHLRDRGQEFGSVTGRPRRCGWFDAAGLKRAVQLNGMTGLCITKLDVLDGLPAVRLGTGYRIDGRDADILPYGAEAVARCEPVYEEFEGWSVSTYGMRQWDELPANARRYLERLAEVLGVPIDLVSTGPDREQTILLRHPFASARR
jgi:adenylosuccinate synthase